jgi:RNA polymerase sigma-70 factor (ECF subfamily)
VDQKRFNEIYDIYSQRLYNYALWLTRNKDAASDIIQVVFVRFWRQDKTFLHDNELEAWLYTVTRNACMDFFRKCARFTSFRLTFARETVLYAEEPKEKRSIWNMLDRLKEKERTILFLHFKTGYSYRKIAEVIDMKESAVRITAFRALEKLRQKCAKEIV